jgi:hypothetical protein
MASETAEELASKERESRKMASLKLIEPLLQDYFSSFGPGSGREAMDESTRKQAIRNVCLYAKDYHITSYGHVLITHYTADFLAPSNIDSLIRWSKWNTLEVLLKQTATD